MKLFNRPFIRSLEGVRLLEIFFVTAVASVLLIRFFLALTGYPSLSPGRLHIAHVLLGGALMLLALLISLGCINKSAHYLAATLGGMGFGAFIDELGKFITGDNDYFYQPTIAMIYVIFVLLYLGIDEIFKRRGLSEQERLINALELAKEVVLRDMDHSERRRALDLLKGCCPSDPVTRSLRELLHSTDSVPARPDIYSRAKMHLRRLYRRLVRKSWFVNAVTAFFLIQSLSVLALDLFLLYAKLMLGASLQEMLTVSDMAGLASATLAAAFVIAGITRLKRSRPEAFRLFKNGVLIQILLVQVFQFYRTQLLALEGLAGNILVLLVLDYMIRQEISAQGESPSQPDRIQG